MIIVTGGAGFIGSNIVKKLNNQGHTDILVVDDLTDGRKFINLADCQITDYQDKDEFLNNIKNNKFSNKIDVIFHEGACAVTTEWNGKYMLENNFTYSKELLHYTQQHNIPFIYASSGAVYGNNTKFSEDPINEQPLNVYGYSKLLFDQYVRKILPTSKSQIVGLRYFNVYGPREQHKGSIASVMFHFTNQLKEHGVVKLFAGSDGYADGEQKRDFIFVEDIADINLWFWQNPDKSGIYNAGTGTSRTFNEVAHNLIKQHGKGQLEYLPFPARLKSCYQSFTEADISKLKQAGYNKPFTSIEEGIKLYNK